MHADHSNSGPTLKSRACLTLKGPVTIMAIIAISANIQFGIRFIALF